MASPLNFLKIIVFIGEVKLRFLAAIDVMVLWQMMSICLCVNMAAVERTRKLSYIRKDKLGLIGQSPRPVTARFV